MASTFVVEEAKRELIWVKIAVMAPSGGGKSYSSLRLATGMLEELNRLNLAKNGKILMGNTEQARGRYYADEFKYDIVNISSPHNPEKYVEFVDFAVANGYPILILDSTTHEWEGKGGCLELHQQAGGTYQSWGKVTPRHDKFMAAIADSPIHIIATMRGKDQYEMEKIDGKNVVKKLGVGARQREGFEYEFTATFNIDQKSNFATVQKDNTHLFESQGEVLLSEKHGIQIVQWANSGEGYTPPVRSTKSTTEDVSNLQESLVKQCQELGGSKNESLMDVLRKADPSCNPKRIKDIKVLNELSESLTIMISNKTSETKEL